MSDAAVDGTSLFFIVDPRHKSNKECLAFITRPYPSPGTAYLPIDRVCPWAWVKSLILRDHASFFDSARRNLADK